jgi:hypothetical protein
VGTTCEWCPIANCEVRVAPPVELENKLRQEEKLLQINKLRDTYF